jgi:hypothetical protein
MGLDSLIRSGVALAASITDDLLVNVTHEAFDSYDGDGAATYETGVTRKAFLEQKNTGLRWRVGMEIVGSHMVTFVGNVVVDMKDRLTLPDGTQPPILEVLGVADPNGGTYYTQVTCGRPERGTTAT